MKEERYDGVEETKSDDGRYSSTVFKIDKALEQENPRNVFLNGQLFVEMQCDTLISIYFAKNDGMRQGVLSEFLKSKEVDFFSKIKLLRLLKRHPSEREGVKLLPLVDKKIITSLITIGSIRNAFQHNLVLSDALHHAQYSGKLAFLDKKLKDYVDIPSLETDFKSECTTVYSNLNDLIIKILGLKR